MPSFLRNIICATENLSNRFFRQLSWSPILGTNNKRSMQYMLFFSSFFLSWNTFFQNTINLATKSIFFPLSSFVFLPRIWALSILSSENAYTSFSGFPLGCKPSTHGSGQKRHISDFFLFCNNNNNGNELSAIWIDFGEICLQKSGGLLRCVLFVEIGIYVWKFFQRIFTSLVRLDGFVPFEISCT